MSDWTFVDVNLEMDRLRGALRADEARLREAEARVSDVPHGCDAPEWMADTILALRAENARLLAACREWVVVLWQDGRRVTRPVPHRRRRRFWCFWERTP